jgi:hypothetical protein
MATTVVLRHKDGRRIAVAVGLAQERALLLKANLERRLARREPVSVNEGSEEVTPRSVVSLDLIVEQERLDP